MDHDSDELLIKFNPSDADTAELEYEFYGLTGCAIPFELALMAAAIRFAIYEKDLRWINDDDRSEYPFTFKNCCEYLGIDYQAARKVLNQRIGKGRRVLLRQPKRLEFEVEDVPAKEYTHAYQECPPGVNPSRCPECR